MCWEKEIKMSCLNFWLAFCGIFQILIRTSLFDLSKRVFIRANWEGNLDAKNQEDKDRTANTKNVCCETKRNKNVKNDVHCILFFFAWCHWLDRTTFDAINSSCMTYTTTTGMIHFTFSCFPPDHAIATRWIERSWIVSWLQHHVQSTL